MSLDLEDIYTQDVWDEYRNCILPRDDVSILLGVKMTTLASWESKGDFTLPCFKRKNDRTTYYRLSDIFKFLLKYRRHYIVYKPSATNNTEARYNHDEHMINIHLAIDALKNKVNGIMNDRDKKVNFSSDE